MQYRARHRQVAHQRWSRRTGTVATVVSAALIAPLAFSGPVASQANTTATTAIDTLANHAEWRLSDTDPAVAAEIAGLKEALNERGVKYDPANVAAYGVPTVDGFTTYVTATPETMAVRPNPLLLERTPEGVRELASPEVLARLLEGGASGGGVGGISLIRDDLWRRLDPNNYIALAQAVLKIVGDHINPTISDPNVLLAQLRAITDPVVAEALRLELSAIVTEVVPLAAAAPPGLDSIMANPNLPEGAREDNDGSAAGWSTRNQNCFKVATEAFWRLVCWRIDGQDKDADRKRNFWQFHVDASGKSVGYRYMNRMWIEAKPGPQGATNQSWDAVAKPSAAYGGSDGCSTSGETMSVSSGAPVQIGFGFYWERTTCETYYPKSYGDDDGHWASVWEGNPYVKQEVHRAVMVKVPVKTPADKGVMWELLTGQRTQ